MASLTSYNEWTPIGRTNQALILYHPPSHAVTVQNRPSGSRSHTDLPLVRRASPAEERSGVVASNGQLGLVPSNPPPIDNQIREDDIELCPYCYRPLPGSGHREGFAPFGRRTSASSHYANAPESHNAHPTFGAVQAEIEPLESSPGTPFSGSSPELRSTPIHGDENVPQIDLNQAPSPSPPVLYRTPPYFHLLQKANTASRPSSPPAGEGSGSKRKGKKKATETEDLDEPDTGREADGYYERFFREEKRLGMGADGSVFLSRLASHALGHYAVKKIAIGTSRPYLGKILKEVRLLEGLRHENVISYHHVWIEKSRFSSFGPPIPALHVLMMYANHGNLDTFIDTRLSGSPSPLGEVPAFDQPHPTKEELKRRFKDRRASTLADPATELRRRHEESRAVMYLGKDEIVSLFGDVVNGLEFLHSNSIIHLDLKCSNVLLHMREGNLIPTALISDFGTSEEMLHMKAERSGNTGTMEYMAPEAVLPDKGGRYRDPNSAVDMWALGLILYKLIFFKLPFDASQSYEDLARQIATFPGFLATPEVVTICERRGIPGDVLLLLARLVHVDPRKRPSSFKVKAAWSRLLHPDSPVTSAQLQRDRVPKTAPHQRKRLQAASPELVKDLSHAIPGEDHDTAQTFSSDKDPHTGPAKSVVYTSTTKGRSIAQFKMQEGWARDGLKGVVAFVKIATLLPPIRTRSLPTSSLYIGMILAVADMTQRDYRLSMLLMILHLAILVAG